MLSYIPKATIQAAFAALPLDRGLPEGNVALGAAIVAILITAPAGVIAITRGVPRLLPNDYAAASSTLGLLSGTFLA